MKPTSFEYHDPTTLDEALRLMAQFGDDARPLAGGQSLVPLMNFRLVKPAHVIDLNGVKELDFLTAENNQLRIGATARQRALEKSGAVAARWPLLRDAASFIGHIQIRNRGTVGGSLAHAFPSAELPVAMVTLDASLILRSKNHRRAVGAEEFFLSYMTTVLAAGELLVEVNVPATLPNTGWSFQEVSRRHGDFALAGAAALLSMDTNGSIQHARLTLTGGTPIRAHEMEAAMLGQRPTNALFRDIAQRAIQDLEQDSDIHASADYRRSACAVMAERALTQAAQRSGGSAQGLGR